MHIFTFEVSVATVFDRSRCEGITCAHSSAFEMSGFSMVRLRRMKEKFRDMVQVRRRRDLSD